MALCTLAIVKFFVASTNINNDNVYIMERMSSVIGFVLGSFALYEKRFRLVALIMLILLCVGTIVAFEIQVGFNYYQLLFVAVFLLLPATLGFLIGKMPIKPAYVSAVYSALLAIAAELMSISLLNGFILHYTIDLLTFSIILALLIDKCQSSDCWKITAVYFSVYAIIQIVFGSYVYYLLTLIPCAIVALSVTAIMSATKTETKKWAAVVVVLLLTCSVSYIATPSFHKFLMTTTKEYRLQASAIKEGIKPRFILDSPDIGQISNSTLLGKTAYLYFWSRGCPQCHALMPLFSEMAESAKADTSRVFMAVYLPHKDDDFSQYEEALLQHDYAFRWAAADTSNTIMQDLRFNGVPHLTILDEDGTVVYNGYPDKDDIERYEKKR